MTDPQEWTAQHKRLWEHIGLALLELEPDDRQQRLAWAQASGEWLDVIRTPEGLRIEHPPGLPLTFVPDETEEEMR